MDHKGKPKTLGVEDPGRESSPVASHPTLCDANSYDLLHITKTAAPTVRPADVKNAEELDFN